MLSTLALMFALISPVHEDPRLTSGQDVALPSDGVLSVPTDWGSVAVPYFSSRPCDGRHAVVCVHGMAHDSDACLPLGEQLLDLYPDVCRFYAPDARGHGRTGWTGELGETGLEDYRADLDAVLLAVKTHAQVETPQITVVAHSMGGLVVLLEAQAAGGLANRAGSAVFVAPSEPRGVMAPALYKPSTLVSLASMVTVGNEGILCQEPDLEAYQELFFSDRWTGDVWPVDDSILEAIDNVEPWRAALEMFARPPVDRDVLDGVRVQVIGFGGDSYMQEPTIKAWADYFGVSYVILPGPHDGILTGPLGNDVSLAAIVAGVMRT